MSVFWDISRQIMNQKSITQADIARYVGKPKGTINRWYNDDIVPPANYAIQIADILGVNLRYLITGKDSAADPVVETVAADQDLRDLFNKIMSLEKKHWHKLSGALDIAIKMCVEEHEEKKRVG